LQEEIGGRAVVPLKTLAPDAGLGIEQRPEVGRREVAQVENFELERGGHRSRVTRSHYFAVYCSYKHVNNRSQMVFRTQRADLYFCT
jgi:hypothetical protein